MRFRTFAKMLEPDPRYAEMITVENGAIRRLTLADHHAMVAGINLLPGAPDVVRTAFDGARNILLYAWFDYDLWVVGESQAFAAFELALKHRLIQQSVTVKGSLRNHIDTARKHGILPTEQKALDSYLDPIEALLFMRNALAHGTTDIHSPGMALSVVEACAHAIDHLFTCGETKPAC